MGPCLAHVAGTWTQEALRPQPHSRGVQGYRHLARACTHTRTHRVIQTRALASPIYSQLAILSPFPSVFPCLCLPNHFDPFLSHLFFFPSPKHPIISLIQSQNTLPVHPIMCAWAVTPLCPWGAPESSSRDSLWWGDALPGQPWEGPRQGHVSPLKLFGSPPPHYYALCSSVCVEMSLLSHNLTNTCFLWDFFCCLGRSFSVSEAYKLCHTRYMKSIKVSKPFPFIFLKNVRLRLKQ